MRLALFSLLFILITSSFSESTSQIPPRNCTIKNMIGTVKIRRNGTVNWIAARPRMALKERDAIRTFIESNAELQTDEGTIIHVSENSTLELSRFQSQQETQNTKIKIMNGALITNVKKLVNSKSSFEFETPTATAAIRGTVVGFDVSAEQTRIKVFEGMVMVTPRGARHGTELTENQMTTIKKGQKKVLIEKLDEKSPIPLEKVLLADSSMSDSVTHRDSTGTDSTAGDPAKFDSLSGSSNDSTGSTPLETDTLNDYSDKRRGDLSEDDSSSFNSSQPIPLKLVIHSPSSGALFNSSSPISISGVVSPPEATVTVNGKTVPVGSRGIFTFSLDLLNATGKQDLTFIAEYNGRIETVTRSVTVNQDLLLNVTSPREGQKFSKPLIPLSGTVTPGAEISAMSLNIAVTAQGTFNGQVPIANEEGELLLEIEARLDGKVQKIFRRIIFKPEYRFILSTPQERQVVSTTQIPVKGEVLPQGAEISVNGRRLSTTSTGLFSGFASIPDEEGSVELEFDISSDGFSKTETRTIIYKRPPDTYRPEIQGILPLSSQVQRLPFTVFDRTIDEEITFYYEIDGYKESIHGIPNSPFYLPLQEGIHTYTVYAVDKAGNQSSKLTQKVAYLGANVWSIKLRKPSGDMVLNLPPSAPDGSYKPRYTIEFSIEKLPGDNIQLIREITVINSTTGETSKQRIFTDNYFEVDIELAHRASNQILIEVLDINNAKKTQRFQIHVR